MLKRIYFTFFILITFIILSGCWSYKEINDMSIVAGVAIDKDLETNQYHITAEIIKAAAGKEAKFEAKYIDSKGDTIFEAIRDMINKSGNKLYWSHAKAIVLSKDVAEEGIGELLDLFARDSELRSTIHMVVSEEKTAREILHQESMITKFISYEIYTMLTEEKIQPKIIDVTLFEFLNNYLSKGISPTMSAIEIIDSEEGKVINFSGTAVFKLDKLVGFLDNQQTAMFRFINGDVKSGLYVVEVPDKDKISLITLEVIGNESKIKPSYKDGKFKIKIEVKTQVIIGDHGVDESFIEEEKRKELEKIAEKKLKSEIEDLIKTVQKEYGVDIFGLGAYIHAEMPSEWKKNVDDWNEIFKNLDVSVSTEFEVKNSALLFKGIKGEN